MEKIYADFVSFQQANFDAFVKTAIEESRKVADLSAVVIKDAAAPLTERVKANVIAINAAAANVQKAATPSKKAA